jgi:putative transposase
MLLDIARSTVYYCPKIAKDESILMNEIVDIHNQYIFYGYRKIVAELNKRGYVVNGKKIRRLMQEMNIKAIYPKPKTSISSGAQVYP